MGKSALSATMTYVEKFLTGTQSPKEYVEDLFKNRDPSFRQSLLEIFTELDNVRNDEEKKSDMISKLYIALSE